MNFFQTQLKKICGDDTLFSDTKYVGCACFGKIGPHNRVRVEFEDPVVKDEFSRLSITITNCTSGPIANLDLELEELWGTKPGKAGRSISPHIWSYNGKLSWYGYEPTVADYRIAQTAVADFIEMYREPELEQSTQMDRHRFKLALDSLIPTTDKDVSEHWCDWANEMAELYQQRCKPANSQCYDKTSLFCKMRSTIEPNLQELLVAFEYIKKVYGDTICQQIYDQGSTACGPWCMYPLEMIDAANFLLRGGSPEEIANEIDKGGIDWLLPDDPALLAIEALTDMHEQQELERLSPAGLTVERKAELFDSLLESAERMLSDHSWYDVLREIGMSNNEMVACGINLLELQIRDEAVTKMSEYIVHQVREADMEPGQTHITFSLDDLAVRFGFNPMDSELGTDALTEELYLNHEVDEVDFTNGELWIKPYEQALNNSQNMIME